MADTLSPNPATLKQRLPMVARPNHGLGKAQILELFQNCIKLASENASYTPEAGVKIYSMRVDSVHSEAYKVLGGMNRAGQEDEQDTSAEDANADNGKDAANSKNETQKKDDCSLTHYSDF